MRFFLPGTVLSEQLSTVFARDVFFALISPLDTRRYVF